MTCTTLPHWHSCMWWLCLGTNKDVSLCCVLLVQPLLSSAGYRYKYWVQVYWGMYKCGGLCWVSTDMQVWSCSLATMCSGSLDLDARGLALGSYTSLLLTKNSKKSFRLIVTICQITEITYLHAVGSAFIILCWVQVQVLSTGALGNVQVRGFMLGEHRHAGMVLQPCYYV